MALRPVDTETFYREVDEELRRDQLMTLWERYRKLAIAAVVLLIALIGFFFWWQNHKEQVAGKRSTTLIDAMDDIEAHRTADAQTKLDGLAKESQAGPRVAALMAKADMALDRKDDKGALAAFRQIADDGDLPQPYRDAALIRMTAIEYDGMKPQAVIDRLNRLAQPGSPWLGTAGEMVAIAYLNSNRPQQAAKLFAQIARDKNAPESLRGRSAQMAGSLGVDVGPLGANQEGK